jgi:hypothetical protein
VLPSTKGFFGQQCQGARKSMKKKLRKNITAFQKERTAFYSMASKHMDLMEKLFKEQNQIMSGILQMMNMGSVGVTHTVVGDENEGTRPN